jgi:TolB-like protein/DNA-binding winged helix-turn-helix (wHTH) protein/Tfp pilus assembly protein PilF
MQGLVGKTSYQFGNFCLIPSEGLLLRDGVPIPMVPKVFETLFFLVERRGTLVRKAELMHSVWADAFVEENAISKAIWSIRQALDEDPKNPKFIQTVPKRGYRFVGEVTESGVNGTAAASVDGPRASNEDRSAPEPRPASRSRTWRPAFAAIALVILLSALFAFRERFSASSRVEIRSMTVIPLDNVSENPAEEYFVNGVTDALIAGLSRVSDLKVIALPAAMRKEPEPRDLKETGSRLSVDAVLIGSVSRSGDQARVVVQLIDISDGRNLWSNSYERDPRDVQRLHKEIIRDVVEQIRPSISPQVAQQLNGTSPVVPEAFDQYLRARFYLNRQNFRDQDVAIYALEEAVRIDPSFAAAYAELAQAYIWKRFSFAPTEKDLTEKASVAVEKAFRLDSYAAAGYLARGRLLWTPEKQFPHEKAILDYRQAIASDPNLDEARNQLAIVYCHVGLLDEALVQAREGVKINPVNNLLQLRIGQTLNFQLKYEEALPVLKAIPVEIHPSMVIYQTAWSLFNLGRASEAQKMVEKALQEHPDDEGGTYAATLAVIEASRGNNIKAEKLIERAFEKGKGYGHFHHTAYTIACAYALMDKRNEAIHWLEVAAETGFPCYPLFERDGNLDNLRKDPGFINFLESQKQQWEHYKSIV